MVAFVTFFFLGSLLKMDCFVSFFFFVRGRDERVEKWI